MNAHSAALDGWGCAGCMLNGIAGGAAMIGGCATAACGAAIVWCCSSGIACYGSALIGIGQSNAYA